MGSFGQTDQVDKGSAHPQTDEDELGDELKIDEELLVVSIVVHVSVSVANGEVLFSTFSSDKQVEKSFPLLP